MTNLMGQIRCNNCMTIYNSDTDLGLKLYDETQEDNGINEVYPVCKQCNTDEYLMDMEVQNA